MIISQGVEARVVSIIKKKAIKKKGTLVNLVLREEVKMNKVIGMVEKIVVPCFQGRHMGEKNLEEHILSNWMPLVGLSL